MQTQVLVNVEFQEDMVLHVTIFRMLHSDQRHPYHLTPVHNLLLPDWESGYVFVAGFLTVMQMSLNFWERFCGQIRPHSLTVA
jgi:hypothetical protein